MNIAAKRFIRMMLCITGFLLVLGAAPKAYGFAPCCNITSIDQKTGTVTAKENSTGRVFTFKVADAQLLSSLKVGQGVYANFTSKQVSLNGTAACCTIVSLQPPDGAKANAAPFAPCCNVVAVSANTGQVNLRENSTGRLITLKVSLSVQQIARTFKVGTAVGFEPVDSAKLTAGSRIRLQVPGFGPVESLVSQIAAH